MIRSLFFSFLLMAAGLAAYSNSFQIPFLFDDFYHIVDNPNLRHGASLLKLLSGSIRPVVEVTLAVNYRLGSLNVWGYHVVNLSIHLLASLTLWGIVRRTLARLESLSADDGRILFPAWAAAAFWMLHPLQTQAVVYVIQRAECLAGLFLFVSLYSFARSSDDARERPQWMTASVLACWLGMGTKATLVAAPILVLLYDRTFLARSFGEILRERRWFYLALFSSWSATALLNLSAGTLEQIHHLQRRTLNSSDYLWAQPWVILHYLRLVAWPRPLVFDYDDWPVVRHFADALPAVLVLGALALFTVWLLRRWRPAGFLGVWFFLTLLPTSSFLPLSDVAFEFRMYLPLAAAAVSLVLGLGRKLPRPVWALILLGLGAGTYLRNNDYRTPLALWSDTVAKRPGNARAWTNLGPALQTEGRNEEAEQAYRRAIELEPNSAEARSNLGYLLVSRQQWGESLYLFQEAARILPTFALAHQGRGIVLETLGKDGEAAQAYQEALRLQPRLAKAHHGLGVLFSRQEKWKEAASEFGAAIRCKPDYAQAYKNLGVAFTKTGLIPGAIHAYAQAVRLDPEDKPSRDELERLNQLPYAAP